MAIGLPRIGLGLNRGGSLEDAVRALFAGGEQGFCLDPSDAATAFQDSAGTTPGVVGQPLGRRLDKSGRGNNATQGTSASRPVWNQSGAFYRDTFDGFDDSLSIAAGGGSTTGFFYCGAIHVAGGAGVNRVILSDSNGNAGYRVRINSSNQLEMLAGNGLAFTSIASVATLPVGGPYLVTLLDDTTNLSVQINQGVVASVARPAVSAGTAALTEGKDNGAATNFFNGSLYNRIYRAGPVPSAAQIAAVQRYIASKAGVTL
jgi:hypothetical protein